jgi:hypothetical protein
MCLRHRSGGAGGAVVARQHVAVVLDRICRLFDHGKDVGMWFLEGCCSPAPHRTPNDLMFSGRTFIRINMINPTPWSTMQMYCGLKDYPSNADIPGIATMSKGGCTAIVVVSGSETGFDSGHEPIARALAGAMVGSIIGTSDTQFANDVAQSVEAGRELLRSEFGHLVDDVGRPSAVSASVRIANGSMMAGTVGNLVVVLIGATSVRLTSPHVLGEHMDAPGVDESLLGTPTSIIAADVAAAPRCAGPWPTKPGDRIVIASVRSIGWHTMKGSFEGWRTLSAERLADRLRERPYSRFDPFTIIDT